MVGVFTGKERDSETGLDYFDARYFSAAPGRFTSPDPPLLDQGPSDPQSWNLYSYVRNNPLSFIDPTGGCSKAAGGYTDEGSGEFPGPCANGTIGGSGPGDSTTVTAKQPKVRDLQAEAQARAAEAQAAIDSLLYGAWQRRQTANQPRPDTPLPPNAVALVQQPAIQNLPVDCGGGGFVFAGREIDLGPVTTFHGGIVEYDSASGVSKGALLEAGAGEGINGGVGATVTTNQKGQVEVGGLVFGGVGAHAGVAGVSAGGGGFRNGVGVYGEGEIFGRALGGGAYMNISSVGRCRQ